MTDPKGDGNGSGEIPKKDYFRIKNDWFDALISFDEIPEKIRCLNYIIRMTYGWQTKNAQITHAEFSAATGIPRPNVHRALMKLKAENIIAIKSDSSNRLTYSFNKYFKTWKRKSRKKTVAIESDSKSAIESDSSLFSIKEQLKNNIKNNERTSNKSKVKTFDPHDISYLLSETLIDQIKRNLPNGKDVQNGNREKTIQRWASDIDKMIRLDNRPVCDIWNMIIWCHYDDFWFKNILSGSKLRKQYDKLSAAITSEVRRKNRNKTQHQKLLEVGERWLQKQGMQDS